MRAGEILKRKSKIILIIVLFLSAFLRFYDLGKNPPSVDWDEAAIGYNAYSILKTGRDEYGKLLPLTFRSFDDFKPPLYEYLTVPSVAVFGLNEFSVRFPSAFLGVLTVLFTYLLVKELFKNEKLSLLTAFFLAVSPWHLQFSSIAFEANGALFFIVSGAFLFTRGVNKNPKLLIPASLFLILSAYTYHSARIFTPLLILGLIVLYRQPLLKEKKYSFPAFLLMLILALPLFKIMLSDEGLRRFKGVSSFSDSAVTLERVIKKQQEDQKTGFPLARIFHNRFITYSLSTLKGYLSHYTPNFLFITGDAPRHHAPGVGLLYWWDAPFFLAGIYYFLKNKPVNRALIFYWFLIAPIAAAPTREAPHAIRSLVFLPTLQIFTAYGFLETLKLVKRKYVFAVFAFFLLTLNFLYYLHMYHAHMPSEYSTFWQYGYKEMTEEVLKREKDYQKVIFSNKLDQPHVFFLFYSKYDPVKYLSYGGTKYGDFGPGNEFTFDKYTFQPIEEAMLTKNEKTLFVGVPKDFRLQRGILAKIKDLTGNDVIFIAETYK